MGVYLSLPHSNNPQDEAVSGKMYIHVSSAHVSRCDLHGYTRLIPRLSLHHMHAKITEEKKFFLRAHDRESQ